MKISASKDGEDGGARYFKRNEGDPLPHPDAVHHMDLETVVRTYRK